MRPSPVLAALLQAGVACAPPAEVSFTGPTASWPAYGGPTTSRHSPLTQITPQNVAQLEVAWTHHTGDVVDGSETLLPGSFQATPILLEDTLYLCTPRNRVVALDAETGSERWQYDPEVDTSGIYVITCRGVSSWVDARPDAAERCRARIFTGTLDARLIALDALTGEPCPDFGQGGSVDLSEGIGDIQPGEYGVTSPPLIVGDRVITGSVVLDNRRVDAPGGVVRAYDARSGRRLWSWDPLPPGSPRGSEAGYRRGTTNAWSVLSADPELGLVYVPTGNTSPDYYGGLRDGLDHYSSSVVALDAATGEVRWHFQTVHHDLWDYDVPAQPTLLPFPGERGPVRALVQATKMGHLFFLDRESGEPLFPVEERPVPADGVPGETVSPTQPFPSRPPPIHPTQLRAEDAFGFTFWDRAACREAIAAAHSEGPFTPPGLAPTLQFPGMVGGSNWGSVAVDADRGVLVANTNRTATRIRLIPRDEFERQFETFPAFGYEPQQGTPYVLERHNLLSPLGAPCNPPPWGALTGVDIENGEILWEVPLGTTRDLAPFPLWLPLGTPNQGGPITTASGLAFIGATTDNYLRAFSTETGDELFRGRLPTAGHATPITYRLREDSRQFVVIAAGGHGLLGTPAGDAVVAFALPEQ